jgi:hypothetical protein
MRRSLEPTLKDVIDYKVDSSLSFKIMIPVILAQSDEAGHAFVLRQIF